MGMIQLLIPVLIWIAPPEILLRMNSTDWEVLQFGSGYELSVYTLETMDGRDVMRAESKASASGLVRRMSVDAKEYPIIEWSWKINGILSKGDARKRSGDDYPARIYITFDVDESASFTDRMSHRAARAVFGDVPYRAINYIWANQLPKGTHVPNPYTSTVCMIAVQSENGLKGTWQAEKRNVLEDYRMCFGSEPPLINGIAIMTDSDNTSESAVAWYGDIRLVRTSN